MSRNPLLCAAPLKSRQDIVIDCLLNHCSLRGIWVGDMRHTCVVGNVMNGLTISTTYIKEVVQPVSKSRPTPKSAKADSLNLALV